MRDSPQRRTRLWLTVIALVLLALGFYIGFIVLVAMKG